MQVLLDGIQILGPMNLVKTFGSEFVVMQMVVAQLRLVAARKSVRRFSRIIYNHAFVCPNILTATAFKSLTLPSRSSDNA